MVSAAQRTRPIAADGGVVLAAAVVIAFAVVATILTSAPWESPAITTVNAGVGAAFLLAGLVATGPRSVRLLVALVGVAWLGGPFAPRLTLAYLGVLAIALVVFPSGRPRGLVAWIIVGLAIAAGLLPAAKPGLALLFGAVAVESLARGRRAWPAAAYPLASGAVLALYFTLSWLVEQTPERFDPVLWVVALSVLLIAIAVAFPVAARGVVRSRAALADLVLGDARLAGLGGLELVLREVLDAPRLLACRWDDERSAYVGPDGSVTPPDQDEGSIEVMAGGKRLGMIIHGTAAMTDADVARAVSDALRLTLENLRWQAALDEQLAELEAARARLVAATDHQRATTAARLRQEVVEPARRAGGALDAIHASETDAEAALTVAREQLEAAAGEVLDLVGGLPPAHLGDGRLAAAVGELAERCPIPVTVHAAPGIAASAEVETTLFYVCSEALTNAVKHAGATRITIELTASSRVRAATVIDDGVGGASPSGAGLRGLADRLAAQGGRLRVDSPPGAGTTLVAEVPA